MVLGVDKLLELVKEKKLVEGLCERELTNPEGAGFDLRLGELFELEGDGFLGIENRDTPNLKKVAEYLPTEALAKEGKSDDPPASAEATAGKEEFFTLEPGKYYLVTTIESVNLPKDLIAFIVSRTTLFRSGIALFNGAVSPGYQGKLTFAICNLGNQKIKIALGARVVHITFHEVTGSSNAYRGQWQGGRVTTKGEERQI